MAPALKEALETWFAKPSQTRGALPEALNQATNLEMAEVEFLAREIMGAYRRGAEALGWEKTLPPLPPSLEEVRALPPGQRPQIKPCTLQIGRYEMPFVMLRKGAKPAAGWPLFICLHGGGGNVGASGPHGWAVNTSEWQAQMQLFERVYEPAGLYFIPRMADDREGRWYYDHNQIAFDEIIRKSILFREVDPNRVYLMGISEGGYTAIRYAGNRPDRFAATGGMAAAEPLDTSPPENMRNLWFRNDIGENDTMFDRINLARRMAARLDELHRDDPGGYVHLLNAQAGRAHGIEYRSCPAWIAQAVRQPSPDRVVWTVKKFHQTVPTHNYWLALGAVPEKLPLYLAAKIKDNVITLTAQTAQKEGTNTVRVAATGVVLRVRLNDKLVSLDRPVILLVNGHPYREGRLSRNLPCLVRTLAEYGDPSYMFPAEIAVKL
jgi:pimeloyl-ACP methyl ester carboxylesterase